MAREQAPTMMAVAEAPVVELPAARWRMIQPVWSSIRATAPRAPGDCPRWAVSPVAKAFDAPVGSQPRIPRVAQAESREVA
jgi:hypothetical protein